MDALPTEKQVLAEKQHAQQVLDTLNQQGYHASLVHLYSLLVRDLDQTLTALQARQRQHVDAFYARAVHRQREINRLEENHRLWSEELNQRR